MDVSSIGLALLLLAEPASAGSGGISAPVSEADAPSHPEIVAFSRLQLSKVRVRTPSGNYVLRRPRFDPDGIAWQHVDGFPRGPRPLFAPGWDTVPPPPNPVPWDRVELLERSVAGSKQGAVWGAATGAALGGAGGAFLGFASALGGGGTWGSWLATTVLGAATVGITLGLIAHAVFDPPERWEPIDPDRAGAAGPAEGRR